MYIDTSNASSGRICLNAAKADQLATARTITLSGDASGSVSFDGSQNVTLAVDISALDNINDAIDTKQATITGAATTITSSNLTASRALISNSSGKVAVSAVTSTELEYLDGVTSNIQTQLDGKAASSHNHSASNITSGTLSSDRLPTVPIAKGGTGATTAAGALTNLGITATAAELNKMDGVTASTAELNYVDGVTSNIQTQLDEKANSNHTHNYAGSSSAGGAATSANKLTTARTISLNGAVSGSVSFDGSKNVSITTSNGQHISNRGSGTYYYKLGTMVADNSGNYGNITISGRLGGWEQSNSANFDIMMLNRSSARDGNTITATVSASGNTVGAFGNCDIVVYKQDDTSEIVYLKLSGYWLYDFDWSVFQHSINYSATNVTPTGTLVWSLSSAPKTILSADGTLYATKFSGSFEGTMENAIKATKDADGNVITDTYMTKVNPTGSGNVSIGRKSGTTTGDKSVAIGNNTTASAEQTIAIGAAASATNTYAVAIGASATASGEQSTAIGTAPTASGKQSTALGVHTTAAGEYSTSMGCWTSSNGIAGTSLGNGSTVDANSWAAVSSGVVTVARGLGQHVFGSYNIPDDAVADYSTPAEHLMIVGNGDVLSDDGVQSNAMTLDWNGNAWFSGDVYVGSTSGTNKDDGAVKLSKDGHTHNYIPSVSSTNKAITRFNGTGGAVQNSKIIIEDTTNSRDNSKGQVIAIPATGSKKMVYGLCTDQTDGTAFIGGLFGSSETSYPYASGLAIGGSSGNLLWKGNKVATVSDIPSIDSALSSSSTNPVQNKVINTAINNLSSSITTKVETALSEAKASGEFKGDKGDKGATGTAGVSISSVKQTTTSTADDGNNIITVTLSNGTTSTFTVQNGSKGSAGTAGKTPVRGTDYWTSADIAEIKSYVDEAILGGAW